MRKLVLAAAAALVLLVTGGALAAKTVTIGPKFDGKTVRLQAGDRLRVSLPGNPSTGYTWKVLKVDRTVLKPGAWSFRPRGSEPGAGGTETLAFKALRSGTTRLKLGHLKAGGTRSAEGFLVIVAVG